MKYYLTISYCFLLLAQAVGQGREVRNYYDAEREVLKERYFVKDNDPGVLYGNYESYYYSGNLKSKGQYVDDESFGFWEYYYENGKLKMAGRLSKGVNQGQWTYYFENGNISMQGNVYNGMRQDNWQHYYENSTLKSEGKYKNDQKVGLWTYYYEDGRRKAQALYKNDQALYKEFYPSGKPKSDGFLAEGKSDSLWVNYYESGLIKSTGNYENGLREGKWVYYFPNGKKHSEGHYTAGVTDGKWTYYHEQGNIASEGAERDGRKEGYWKLYYDNGNIKGEGVFEKGIGDFSEFYESGKLKAKGKIESGKNQGKWIYYYENGEIEGECDFEAGVGDYTGYYPDGSIKLKGKIEDNAKVGIWELYDEKARLVGYYRPVYEEEPSIFRATSAKEITVFETADTDKPEYLFRSKNQTYFTKRLNEYMGFIAEANPIYLLLGTFPISFEYYMQERMGIQLQVGYIRKPFYTSKSRIEQGEIFEEGFQILLRHKYYHRDRDFGMPYFAYDLKFANSRLYENTDQGRVHVSSNRFSLGLVGGSRWLLSPDDKGFTFDIYAGIGAGYQQLGSIQNIPSETIELTLNRRSSGLFIEPRIGFMLGYNFSLTKKKSRAQ